MHFQQTKASIQFVATTNHIQHNASSYSMHWQSRFAASIDILTEHSDNRTKLICQLHIFSEADVRLERISFN